jgi:DNA-directed RNA polymerase specialized sigma24 family protein
MRSSYGLDEVRVWIEEYEEFREKVDTRPGRPLTTLLSKVDIDRALSRLGPKEYQAVLLCGLLNLTTRTAGALLGTSAMTMSRRYRFGLERLVIHLNGSL